jgi:hypothetical protein
MLAADHYDLDVAVPNHELLEIHHGKISQHHAKAGYNYPTIHLPFVLKRGAPEVKL